MPCITKYLPIVLFALLIMANVLWYSKERLQGIAIARLLAKLELWISDCFSWVRKRKFFKPRNGTDN